MRDAIKGIAARGRRDRLVFALHSYSHSARLMPFFCGRALRSVGLDQVDVLLLGYHSRPPSRRILDAALGMQRDGMVRFIGLTGHKRSLFPELARDEESIDVLHLRYNAVNRGADQDVFPHLPATDRPGMVAFTATRWGQLLQSKRMPPGEEPATAADCYRFALSHPDVDVCLMGPRSSREVDENLSVLEAGPLSDEELSRMHRIGDHIYGKER